MNEVVYFVRAENTGNIKIGWTCRLSNRLSGLRTSSSEVLTLLGAIPGGRDLEARLHRKFKHLHERREWFRGERELLEYIRLANEENGPPPPQTSRHSGPEVQDRYSAAAAGWLKFIEGRVPSRKRSERFRAVADKVGLPPYTVENIVRKRSFQITVANYELIRNSVIAEYEQAVREYREEMKTLVQPDLERADALLISTEKLLKKVREQASC